MSDEKPRIEPASNGYQVSYKGRRLYSPRDPRGGAIRRASAAGTIRPQTLLIVPSPLLGYGLTHLLDRSPPDSVILAVELDPQLAELTGSGEPASELPRDSRVIWALAPEKGELDALLPRILGKRPRRTQIVALSGGFGLYTSEYRRLAERIEDEIRVFWQNAMTRVHMGRLWIRNLFRNLPLLPESVPLDELQTQLPTIVFAAGPSLDEVLHRLPDIRGPNRERVRIIAVDTAVAPLSSRGIRPDIVVAVESQQANAADFLADGSTQPHLICDLTAYPGTAHAFDSKRLSFVSSRFAPVTLLDRLGQATVLPQEVPPLGSVGVLAVHLARRLGSGPVFFAGLDFSYDLERTHARGAPMHTLSLLRRTRLEPSLLFGMALNRPLVTLSDKTGRNARSDTVLLSYAEQLRAVVQRASGLYDLTPEHGLPNGAPPATQIFEAAEVTAGARPHSTQQPGGRSDEQGSRGRQRPHGGETGHHTSPSPEKITEVLEYEQARLSELIEHLQSALHRAGSAESIAWADYQPLILQLEACDYVHLDFPDPPTESRVFLGRVLLSALSYQQKLEDVGALLGRIRSLRT